MRIGVWEAYTGYKVPKGATSRKRLENILARRTYTFCSEACCLLNGGKEITVPFGAAIMTGDTQSGKYQD